MNKAESTLAQGTCRRAVAEQHTPIAALLATLSAHWHKTRGCANGIAEKNKVLSRVSSSAIRNACSNSSELQMSLSLVVPFLFYLLRVSLPPGGAHPALRNAIPKAFR